MMLLVGAALDHGRQVESSLYSKEFIHLFRSVKKLKKSRKSTKKLSVHKFTHQLSDFPTDPVLGIWLVRAEVSSWERCCIAI